MPTLINADSLDLKNDILQISALQFPDGSIQSEAAQNTDSSIIVNGASHIKQINFLNSGGLLTATAGNTVSVYLSSALDQVPTLTVKDEGTIRTTKAASLNFIGTGVSTSVSQDNVTINIPGANAANGGIAAPVVTVVQTSANKTDYSIQGYTNNAAENYLVCLGGVIQTPYTDYFITLNTINLLPAPLADSVLAVFSYQMPVQGGSGLILQEDNNLRATSPSVLNFKGNGVDVTANGGNVTIDVPGNNSITLQRNGDNVVDTGITPAKIGTLNFVGDNIALTVADSVATISIDTPQPSVGFTGITISSNGRLLGTPNGVDNIILEGLGIGASTTLNSNVVRVQVPGTLIKNEGIEVGFANTINFVGKAINASLNNNGVATVDSTAITNNDTAYIQSLTAGSLSFPTSAISTLTNTLSSNGEFLLINVGDKIKAIKLFDIVS